LDQSGSLHHGLLALRRLFGAHSGENQAEILWLVVTEYQIQNSLGYFTLDNASNNLSTLRCLNTKLSRFQQHSILASRSSSSDNSRYIRCYGHVLNLVVKVFLYSKKPIRLVSSNEKKTIEKENEEIEKWRKIGPLGKLRNITVWIHGSPQRREAFCHTVHEILSKTTQARELILGNVTRWTGDYDGLERALQFRYAISFHVENLIRLDHNSTLVKDLLTPTDWFHLQLIFDFLKPFRDETLRLEGHRTQGSLFDIYPSLELLWRHLIATQSSLKGQLPFLDISFQLAVDKMSKYYSLSSLSPIICASVILNPNMDNFFEDQDNGWGLRPEWGMKAKRLVQELWESSYKHLSLHTASIPSPSSPKRTQDPESISNSTSSNVRSFKKAKLTTQVHIDELTRYQLWVESNEHTVEQPILWWLKSRKLYPRLSILALDALSVPAMSAECERVFSR